ncbi:MAG: hypothetical protein COA79_19465 [Planctomycetota bacterium]|nr:MAG: hypothetical protein COA79_19465 [Planctomycetota bacterium]
MRLKLVLIFSTLLSLNIFGKDIVNEYYTNLKCKKKIDLIIKNSGGEETLKSADNVIYDTYVNLKLLDLNISYHQIIKRKKKLFLMEKKIFDEKVVTGFDGKEVFQSAYGKLFFLSERKQTELMFSFRALQPHQFVLKLKDKKYDLKYLGELNIKNKKVIGFSHVDSYGEERHYFDTVDYKPIYSTCRASDLFWEVERSSFTKKNGIVYPVVVKLFLDKLELYSMTIVDIIVKELEAKEFNKPPFEKLKSSLKLFQGQYRLKEIYKAFQLYREYDPTNNSYPFPDKVKVIMGVQPQLGRPREKIGKKGMFKYKYFRGKKFEKLELDHYSYHLKGKVHPFTPLVWDVKGNYKKGRNVLFADGSISYLTETQFQSYHKKALARYPLIKVKLVK